MIQSTGQPRPMWNKESSETLEDEIEPTLETKARLETNHPRPLFVIDDL
jgi:hypothetical protein